MEKILVLGFGGHAKSVVDAIESRGIYEVAGFVDKAQSGCEPPLSYKRYSVIGTDADLARLFADGIQNIAVGVGTLGDTSVRRDLYRRIKEIGYRLPVICDATAIVAEDARIAEGSFIGKRTVINANAEIGKMCIINTGAIIEHDCRVEEFSHVSVGCSLCGAVHVGADAFVGAGATVIQGISIGEHAMIAAGAVVTGDVEHDARVAGVPAVRM